MNLEHLFSKKEIEEQVQNIALQINKFYGSKELIAIGILKGAFVFYSDLLKNLNQDISCDFCSVSFYKGQKKNQNLGNLDLDIRMSIKDKDVLLVDCISDTGCSFDFVKKILEQRSPRSIKMASLILKPKALENLSIDFKGFEVSQDCFVVGYGIDYKGENRHLDYFAKIID